MKKSLLLLSLFVSAASAATVFNFETLPAASGASLSQTVGGITLTVTTEGGGNAEIRNLSSFSIVPVWGSRTLSPFLNTSSALILTFSAPIDSISVEFGDFGADSDTNFLMQGYSGANLGGALLGSTNSPTWGLADIQSNPASVATLNAAGMQSIRLIGGSTGFPNSLFYDNITVTESGIPEPGTYALTAGALLALAAVRRRSVR
jgi:hypothetical protein